MIDWNLPIELLKSLTNVFGTKKMKNYRFQLEKGQSTSKFPLFLSKNAIISRILYEICEDCTFSQARTV